MSERRRDGRATRRLVCQLRAWQPALQKTRSRGEQAPRAGASGLGATCPRRMVAAGSMAGEGLEGEGEGDGDGEDKGERGL